MSLIKLLVSYIIKSLYSHVVSIQKYLRSRSYLVSVRYFPPRIWIFIQWQVFKSIYLVPITTKKCSDEKTYDEFFEWNKYKWRNIKNFSWKNKMESVEDGFTVFTPRTPQTPSGAQRVKTKSYLWKSFLLGIWKIL